jgi:hypothetical protein
MNTDKKLKILQDLRKAITALGRIAIEDVRTVYFGKQGCACGCGGDYRETPRSIKTAITKIKKKAVELEQELAENGFSNIDEIGCIWFDTKGDFGDHIISWEGPERAIRIYTKKVFGDIK